VGDVHVPDSTTVVHVPNFEDAAISLAITSGDFSPCKKLFLESNWITSKLRCHVKTLFPKPGEIDIGTGVRDTQAFQNACAILFHEGRIFVSTKQLRQVATLFLEKWSVRCVQHGKKIVCYYHLPMTNNKKGVSFAPQDKRAYTVQESQKALIKCPFEVKFSLIGYVALRKVPDVFHEVKITQNNFQPSCQLSPTYLHQAKKRRGGHLKLDIPRL
jgi:hypothetical protein